MLKDNTLGSNLFGSNNKCTSPEGMVEFTSGSGLAIPPPSPNKI